MGASVQHYKTTECIVAFIDILGSSDMIMKNPQESLEIVHGAYSESVDLFEQLFGGRNLPRNSDYYGKRCRKDAAI